MSKRGQPPLTARERGAIVQILRCAAELIIRPDDGNKALDGARHFPVINAIKMLGSIDNPLYDFVYAVRDEVGGERDQWQLLEAAARVEEGWDP